MLTIARTTVSAAMFEMGIAFGVLTRSVHAFKDIRETR